MSAGVIELSSWRVALLQGGESAEREVSLRSGTAVAEALRSRGHRVTCIDPAHTALAGVDWPKFDIAFLALHGRFGEDGQIQSLFDSWGVPYTGSEAASSRLAFSKSAAKERFAACGVSTPGYVLIHETDSLGDLHEAADQFEYPLVVKPDASGSSLGVSLVTQPEELAAAVQRCFGEGPFGLIERMVHGTEWTVALIDDEPLPPVCIESQRSFYDYAAKYEDAGTDYRLEAEIPETVRQRITQVAASAALAVGSCGVARVDLRVDHDLQPWVLEVNTIPGFTEQSLVPKAAAHAGISFPELCERAIRCGLNAHQQRRHNTQNASTRTEIVPLRTAG